MTNETVRRLVKIVRKQQRTIRQLMEAVRESTRIATQAKYLADSVLDKLNEAGVSKVDSDPSPTRRF